MNGDQYTYQDLLGNREKVAVVLTTETLRNVEVHNMDENGVLVLEALSEKTLRFIPWTAVKQIYRKLK